jgi:hypothetical protein
MRVCENFGRTSASRSPQRVQVGLVKIIEEFRGTLIEFVTGEFGNL